MRWVFSLLCLVVLAVASCEALLGAAPSSSSGLLKTRGGAVIKKSMATAKASTSSSGIKRTRVYKKEGFLARFLRDMKTFVKSYFASLINPTFEKELTKSSSITGSGSSVGGGGSAAAALKASAARRKRTGGRRTGSISDLAPEPSSCGG